jgi:hypothetical protein
MNHKTLNGTAGPHTGLAIPHAGIVDGQTKAKAVADAAIAAAAWRYPAVYQSMLAVSLMGSAYGCEDDADIIGRTLEPTLPDVTAYRINRAMAQGLHGNAAAAERTLQSVLDASPDDDCAKVVLAVSKMLCGDPEWQAILENLFASSTDPVARNAASNVVAYLMQAKF